jgi:hypothetical protein
MQKDSQLAGTRAMSIRERTLVFGWQWSNNKRGIWRTEVSSLLNIVGYISGMFVNISASKSTSIPGLTLTFLDTRMSDRRSVRRIKSVRNLASGHSHSCSEDVMPRKMSSDWHCWDSLPLQAYRFRRGKGFPSEAERRVHNKRSESTVP